MLKYRSVVAIYFMNGYWRQAIYADSYPMSYLLLCCIILTLALSLPPAVLGEVYKWVDAEGQVHYSDRPPPEVKNAEVVDIPESGLETAPAAPAQPDSSAEELERIRKLTEELEKDRKAREAERAAQEEQRRRESLANQYREPEAAVKQEPDVELYYSYPYPAPYGCYPSPLGRCGPRHSVSHCLLYPWTCNTLQPSPLLTSPSPAPRPPWRPTSPWRPTPPPRPPQRPVHPPIDRRPPPPDLKQVPPELRQGR